LSQTLWQQCLSRIETELTEQQLNTWVRPLQAEESNEQLRIFAPNRFVLEWINENLLEKISLYINNSPSEEPLSVSVEVGSNIEEDPLSSGAGDNISSSSSFAPENNLNSSFTFSSFVEGKSNQLARAAALQVANNPGTAYNPFLLYGGVGLGKTHLMHSIGNHIQQINPNAKVVYLHSERFVADMVRALQHNAMGDFKACYRGLDVLLIDDIQFFAGKEHSQEEFFHTFNALLEGQHQVVLSCDRYPNEVDGIEERLRSRFGWGLTQAIEPPELETRVAIMQNKAALSGARLPDDVAFFIAKRIKSNIRELEGALRRVVANSEFTGKPITLDFAKDALRDLLASQDKLVTIDSIQKSVASYYKIRVSDLLSARRSRSIARPRQVAMSLAKDLTSHSLPEIGDSFGGRDHTTVLHACKKISQLKKGDIRIKEDCINLVRILSN